MNKARRLLKQEKFHEAALASSQAIDLNFNLGQAHLIRCQALAKLGKHDEALADAKQAKARGLSYKEYIWLGDAFAEMGHSLYAVEAYDTARKRLFEHDEYGYGDGDWVNEIARRREAVIRGPTHQLVTP